MVDHRGTEFVRADGVGAHVGDDQREAGILKQRTEPVGEVRAHQRDDDVKAAIFDEALDRLPRAVLVETVDAQIEAAIRLAAVGFETGGEVLAQRRI